LPQTSEDFSPPIDPGETKNVSFDFTQGLSTSALAVGETIVSVTFQMNLVSGIDPSPSSRLLGSGVVQSGGLIVTQKIGTCQPGATYELVASATTSAGQVLTPYSHIACRAVS
jgi:hypothetical protein